MASKYKICCTTWHVMHLRDQALAMKDVADFYIIHNNHRSWFDPGFKAVRDMPDNIKHVSYYEPGKYDLVILNVDQQLANHELGKYRVMKELLDEVRKDKETPLVIINHGCPVYPEYLRQVGQTDKESQLENIKLIRELVGDTPMVVNSYDAASEKEWGWGNPIWHGINPDDWVDLPKEPRIFTALSPAGCDAYYNRECMNEVSRVLKEHFGYKLMWAKRNISFDTPQDYREYLGRSLIYLDTSFRTPMNRGRTEAMLSGCCVIQVEGAHDLDRFVVPGKNMILVPNRPEEIAIKCVEMIEKHYKKAIEIGQAGEKTAREKFSPERYKEDWLKLIKKVCE